MEKKTMLGSISNTMTSYKHSKKGFLKTQYTYIYIFINNVKLCRHST